jgi:ParB family transcriptional regulator, chromosome partitioning protein
MGKTAIDAPRTNAFLVHPDDLDIIAIKEHPLYDERAEWPVDEGMVKDIMVNGVIEPVVITKDGEGLVVVDGRQRVKSAREACKRLEAMGREPIRVTCIIRKGTENDLFGVSISANEHRKNDGPLVKADKATRLFNMGKSFDEISIAFGVSPQTIKNWMALNQVAPAVRSAVERGEVTATAAGALASLPKAEQLAKLEEMKTAGGKVTVERAKRAAKGDTGFAQKMRSRFEVAAKSREEFPGDTEFFKGYRAALLWVLGNE